MSSSALAKSSDTAEDRLVQAIKRFEAQLSPEQRKIYHENESSRPTTSDVSKLLVEVDRQVKVKHSTRTAFKPRLESVILAIQKFASIGDVLIGGSQNLIACGVWSIARIALLATTSSLSIIEELSSLFMAVGASAPYHDEIALLYPQSTRLRRLIHEYHIVVVEVCHQLLIALSKSVLGRLRFAFSDKNYRAQLERWGTAISREIQLCMAQNLNKQASETSKFRSNVLQRFSENKLSQQMKARYKLLKACSTYEYRSSLQQLEKMGNAEFFLSEPAYLDWRGKVGSTLLINGKLGAGKSVLTTSIIKDIATNGQNATVGYFFCRHDIPQSLKAHTISGALCKQILEPVIDLSVFEKLLRSYMRPLDMEAIKSIILRALPPSADVYLIIDGLDECDEADQKQVVELLELLQKSLGLRICLSCRTQPDPPFWMSGWLQQYQLSIPENNPDIHDYIHSELARRLENGTLKLIDSTLIEEIYTALCDGANGMFLWVALQIDCICYEETDERIRSSLGRLPKTLPELYARILGRAAEGDIYHDQDRVCRLILAAFRPLRKDELEDALSVVPGDTKYDSKRRAHSMERLLRRCASLVAVDEEYHTVQLIHQSVRAYLMTDHIPNDGVSMDEESVHKTMADIIVTYLSYGEFDHQVSTNVLTSISAQTIQKKVVNAVLPSSTGKLAALRLLHKISGADINLAPALNVHNAPELGEEHLLFSFRFYAEDHFGSHALFCNYTDLPQQNYRLIDLAKRKESTVFKVISSRLVFTWGSYSLNDLILAGLQLTSLTYETEGFIWKKDGNQQYLIEWCIQNNYWRLARLYWSSYQLHCLEFRRTNIYTNHSAMEFCKWFCLAVKKGYYDLASVLFPHELLNYLQESVGAGLTFRKALQSMWMQEGYEAIKWIANHIFIIETSSYYRSHSSSKLERNSEILGNLPIYATDMSDWLVRRRSISESAINAFWIVIYVSILNKLCNEVCSRNKLNASEFPQFWALRSTMVREISLRHVQEWTEQDLSHAVVPLKGMTRLLTNGLFSNDDLYDRDLMDRCIHIVERASRQQRPDMKWLLPPTLLQKSNQ